MTHYNSGKKKFSKILTDYLEIENKPYYITYIYTAFLNKISNMKSYNSYKLDIITKDLLKLEYANYVRVSQIKRAIREYHILSYELPNGIYSMSTGHKIEDIDNIEI
jgi:hypothetical protein